MLYETQHVYYKLNYTKHIYFIFSKLHVNYYCYHLIMLLSYHYKPQIAVAILNL